MEKHIRQSNLIEGIDSSIEDDQSMRAWEILSKETELNHHLIWKIQGIITDNQSLHPMAKGAYRDWLKLNVEVGGKIAPPWSLVKGLMDNWLLDYYPWEPVEAHIKFEKIHPFVDGNGRTGRMLLWWHQIKRDRNPTLFLDSEKYERYYPLFK